MLENLTIEFLDPLIIWFQGAWQTVQVLLGGLFGLYLISIILRYYWFKNIDKSIKHIKKDLSHLHAELVENKVIKPQPKTKKRKKKK